MALTQLILAIGENMWDTLIDNYGHYSQFKELIQAIQKRDLNLKSMLQKEVVLTPKNAAKQMNLFLRYFVTLCSNETSVMRTIKVKNNYKPLSRRKVSGLDQSQIQSIRDIWRPAVRKEAIHLLIMAKLNCTFKELEEFIEPWMLDDYDFKAEL